MRVGCLRVRAATCATMVVVVALLSSSAARAAGDTKPTFVVSAQTSPRFSAVPVSPHGVFAPGEDVAWTVGSPDTVPPVAGWSFWAKCLDSAWVQYAADPHPFLAVRMGNGDLWALTGTTVSVEAGQVWTFTAVVGGRNLGGKGGAGGMDIVAHDGSGQVVNWQLGHMADSGTFGWKLRSVTVTVPAGVAKLTPRFSGYGGGQQFVAATAFEQRSDPSPLAIPEHELPPPDTPPTAEAACSVVDAYGREVLQGTVRTGQRVRVPAASAGYYELRAGGERLSSAIVVPNPGPVAPGSHPFGVQASPEDLVPRLGLSWTRPLHYNIVSGSHRDLPADLAAYAQAWEAKVRAGLPPSHAGCVELWNEPEGELGQQGRDWTMGDFVAMVRASREGIKRADPRVKVGVNFVNYLWSTSSTYREFVRAGGGPLHDAATIHPYSMHLFNEPIRPDSPEEDLLPEFVSSIRELMRQEGVGDKEVWSTEYGWPTTPGHRWSTSELDQARYIVRSSVLQVACGVTRVNPFRMTDVPEWGPMDGSFGMMRSDGSPRPAMAAYATLAQTVGSLPYAGVLTLPNGEGVRNIGPLVFGTRDRAVLVLWKIDGEAQVKLSVPAETRLVSMLGGESLPQAGRVAVGVSPSPVYLVCGCSSQQLAAAGGGRIEARPPVGLFDVGRVSKLRWDIPTAGIAPTIDGDLGEWRGPAITLGKAGQGSRATVRVSVDRERLYLGASVRGPSVSATNIQPPDSAWNGSGIDLYLSAQPDGRLMRAMREGSDRRVLLVPGREGERACAVDLSPGGAAKLMPRARVAVRPRGDGYDLEATLPLGALGMAGRLRPGAELAFDVAVNLGDGSAQTGRLALHEGQSWFTSYVWGTARVVER